jgi:hypothetical protein
VGILIFALENAHVNGVLNAVAPVRTTNGEYTRAYAAAFAVPRPAFLFGLADAFIYLLIYLFIFLFFFYFFIFAVAHPATQQHQSPRSPGVCPASYAGGRACGRAADWVRNCAQAHHAAGLQVPLFRHCGVHEKFDQPVGKEKVVSTTHRSYQCSG